MAVGTGQRLITYIKPIQPRRSGGDGGVVVWLETRDPITNALETPGTSIQIDMWDSEGTQIWTNQAMEDSSTGLYYYPYAFASDSPLGTWYYWCHTVDDSTETTTRNSFFLKE